MTNVSSVSICYIVFIAFIVSIPLITPVYLAIADTVANQWMRSFFLLSTITCLLSPRPGFSTCFRLCLHCWHMRSGLLVGVCLFFLPSLPDVSGTDHQGVVLISPTLQPGTPGQLATHLGRSLVPMLALPTHPITSTWGWNKLPGHRITGAQAVTA